jgi:hypothetical protein
LKKPLLVGLALLAAVLVIVALSFDPASMASSRQKKNDALIEEQLAYHYGVAAYLYGYPLVDMYKQMHNETHRTDRDQKTYAPVNRFYRFPDLVEPSTSGNFRAPNNDTLYYTAWFDISREPLIIHTPDTGGRYFTIAVTNQYAEVFHIGRRTTGTEEAYFALIPPHWQGELPPGVRAMPTETNTGWLLGRMLVDGPEDFDAAMALVDRVWLASLSEFAPGRPPPLPAEQRADPIDPLDSLAFFQVMNRQLAALPARPGEAALMAMFDAIGVGPASEFDPDALSDATRRGLERALSDAREILEAGKQRTIPDFNGWMISKDIGRYGYQYLHRASVVAGGYGNLPEESLYPATVFDGNGHLLSGDNTYRLHFDKGQTPPVNGFWSLSVYNLDSQLEENPIRRYSIGDRTEGLLWNNDGSLTLWLQHGEVDDPEKNWLPTPAGHFFAVMRLYEPAQEALTNEYLLPRLERVR